MAFGHYGNEQYNAGPGTANEPFTLEPPMNNLELWLKADAGVTGTTPITVWTDQSTNSYSFTPSGSGPDLIASELNGRPVVRFAAPEALHATVTAIGSINQLTMAVVMKTTADRTGDDYMLAFPNNATGNNGINLKIDAAELVNADVNTSSGFTDSQPTTSGTMNDGTARIFTLVWENSGPSATLYINSTLEDTETNANLGGTLLGASTEWSVGGHGSGIAASDFTGDIAEALMWDTALGSSERTQLWNYLAGRWGITL